MSSTAGAERLGSPSNGRLVVLAGPAGVGKTTVLECVRRHHPEVWVSVSVTTRAPRPGEIDGVHYRFVSGAEFDALVADGALLEWAQVHGSARYGTPREPVEQALTAGRPALLQIDVEGARQVRRQMPDALLVFLAPPSWQEMEARLSGRGTEDQEQRRRRLDTARAELAAQPEFDVTIVNHDVRQACEELVGLLTLRQGLPVPDPQ